MNQMTNQETDTALILEGELKRRVKEVVEPLVADMARRIIREELNKYKSEMMLVISVSFAMTEKQGFNPIISPSAFQLIVLLQAAQSKHPQVKLPDNL